MVKSIRNANVLKIRVLLPSPPLKTEAIGNCLIINGAHVSRFHQIPQLIIQKPRQEPEVVL